MMADPENGNGLVKFERTPRADADKGREPDLIPGRMGTRMFSRAALLERVEVQFFEEFGEDSPALREADTRTKRLKLLLNVADYVLAVESVNLPQDEKAALVRRAYSDLFGYGPLDPYFADAQVTTISLEGADKAAVRYGHGELTAIKPLFDDEPHLRQIMARLLMHAGAELRPDEPYIETGLVIDGRAVCVNVVAPPVAVLMSADIRVHPTEPPTLDALVSSGYMTAQARDLLEALVKSEYGMVVVGDAESGKTTLLGVLASLLPALERVLAVERAGELRLPPGAGRLTTRYPVGEQMGATFGEQIGAALEKSPTCLLLDEVRSDQPEMIAPLLSQVDAPRQLWSFRGAIDAKRLQSGLGMLARRADMSQSEAMVLALYRRLPFVVTTQRFAGKLRLFSVAEWQFRPDSDYPDYVPLMQVQDGVLRLTGKHPVRGLQLDKSFWGE